MEERTINEKESLELISLMIKQTKEKLNMQSLGYVHSSKTYMERNHQHIRNQRKLFQ